MNVGVRTFMMALLMAWSVVVYTFSSFLACSKEIVPLAGSKTLAVPWYRSAISLGQHS